ncbi:MAG: lysophospholipid acyltransferase family protein [Bacteroidota bacterium]
MQKIRGIYKLLGFTVILAFHVTRVIIKSIWAGRDPNFAWGIVKDCGRDEARWLGIDIEWQGRIPEEGALILPNHRSYLDIIHFVSIIPVCFVAKIEVSKWPLISKAARIARTIFVDRKDKNSRQQTRNQVKERLKEGVSVLVFPEGTTHMSPEVGELHKGIFYVAAGTDVPVIPAAVEYQDPEEAWVGDDGFIEHFVRRFSVPGRKAVKIRFGEPIKEEDGEVFRQRVGAWIQENTRELQEEFGLALDSKLDHVWNNEDLAPKP